MTVWPVRRTLEPLRSEGSALRDALASLRDRVASARDAAPRRARLVRVEIELDAADPLAFLAAQAQGERRYFRSRDGVRAVAGIGAAIAFPRLDDPALTALLSSHPRLVAFLAGRFDPTRGHELEWQSFGESTVVVPAIEMRREGDRTTIAAQFVGDARDVLRHLERVEGEEQHADPHSLVPEHSPGFGANRGIDSSESAWRTAVEATLRDIEASSVRKVVLARTRTFRIAEPLEPCELLLRLTANEPGTYQFLIEGQGGVSFVGASPERLFWREGRRLESEAVAGTRPRAESPDEDRRLADVLFASMKDRHEHQLVLDEIRERLAPLVSSLRFAPHPRLLRLANVQHLCSPVSASLRDGVTDAELLDRLHPTPAVCGQPIERARTIIRACEPFDRGLYAGPVGVVGAVTEVCVAIRSALIAGRSVTAFAGAGVVAGSTADTEWLETEHKLATFERLVRPA